MKLSEYIEWLQSWPEDMDKQIAVYGMPLHAKQKDLSISDCHSKQAVIKWIDYEAKSKPVQQRLI